MAVDRKRGLIVFLKPPKYGKVKSRLADDIGKPAALQIYQRLVAHTLHVANGVNAFKYIFLSSSFTGSIDLPQDSFALFKQKGKDLGERMQNAFGVVFAEGVEKALIIGSDNIQITPQFLETAYDALFSSDLVLGPSNDGGYYLLGMKGLEPALFTNMEWSTDTVRSRTVERANRAGLSVAQLETLPDIDQWEDLEESNWRTILDKKEKP